MGVHAHRVAVGVLGVYIGPSFQTLYNHLRLDEVRVNASSKRVDQFFAFEFTVAKTHWIYVNMKSTWLLHTAKLKMYSP